MQEYEKLTNDHIIENTLEIGGIAMIIMILIIITLFGLKELIQKLEKPR